MSVTKSTPKPMDDIPIEEVEKLAAVHETVIIKVRRRNAKGQISTCYSGLRFASMDLATIDSWCKEHAGGGRYRIEVYQVDAPTQRPMAPFEFLIEGPPQPPRNINAPAPVGPSTGMPYPAQPQPVYDAAGASNVAWAAGIQDPQIGRAHV